MFFQHRCTLCIRRQPFFLVMLFSINFKHQFCCITIEVDNTMFNDPLFVKFHRIISQESISQFFLLRRHFTPKLPGIGQQLILFCV